MPIPTTRLVQKTRVYEFKPADPPAEIQLWNVGDNPTDYGVHRWTERSVREVMARYESRGNPLQIDIEHNCSDPKKIDPANPPPTGGYAKLEIRDGAPWLVFDWSEYAIEQIRTRQRLFLSPEYCVDEKTKEITALIRVSLVGSPGTHHARMLASAKRVRAGGQGMDLAELLKVLKGALESENPVDAIRNIITELEAMVDGAGDNAPDPETAEGDDDPEKPTTAEGDDDDPNKDKPVSAKTKTSAMSSDHALSLAQRVAALEEENRRIKVEARIAAAGDRIPESLRAFAKTLDLDALEKLIAGLPPGKTTGIRASAKTTRGEATPAGELPEKDRETMDRIFGNRTLAAEPITVHPDGRVTATHLYKRGK